MSDLSTLTQGRSWLDALPPASGFRADTRFAAPSRFVAGTSGERFEPAPPAEAVPIPDPALEAFAQGMAEGHAQAMEEFEARRAADEEALSRLSLSFARLDAQAEVLLRERLRETVAALCEASLAPFALDPEALDRRIAAACAMLARADDERVVRMNPADLPLVGEQTRAQWQFLEDPALERGSIRVESTLGGVEDGPAIWRQAIAEALHQC